MQRIACLFIVVCLAGLSSGCGSATGTDNAASAEATPVDSSNLTQVTLKLPNMFCENCAASVQEDLQKIDGVVDIETNVESHTASFKLQNPELDYQSELKKLAESSTHLEDFEVQ